MAAVKRRQSFIHLLKGCTADDLHHLANFDELAKKVKFYCAEEKAVRPLTRAQISELGWPLVWILARYSPRYIFLSRRLPSTEGLVAKMKVFENKMRWKWHFRRVPGALPAFAVDAPSAACRTIVAPELTAWLGRLRRQVVAGARMAFARSKFFCSHANTSGIDMLGLRLLRHSTVHISKCDKEPGFVIVNKADHVTAMRNLLASPVYEEVTAISNDADLRRRVYRLAKLISDHEGDEIGRLCTKSLRHPSASIEARLQDTCKSHKEDGNVGFRNIHGCPSYLFSGLSGYIAWCLRKRFAALRAVHLVKSSQQIVEDIRGIRLPQGEQLHFVRLDVRDFFLSGSLGTIMSTIRASAWNSRRSQLVEEF